MGSCPLKVTYSDGGVANVKTSRLLVPGIVFVGGGVPRKRENRVGGIQQQRKPVRDELLTQCSDLRCFQG